MIPSAADRAASASADCKGEFSDHPPGATKKCQAGWIEVQILNEAEEPITGLPFTIQLTDGKSVTDKLGAQQRWNQIPLGACKLDLSKLWDDLKQAASLLK